MRRRYSDRRTIERIPTLLRPTSLLRHFKGGRLMLNEVGGQLWVTDSYMAARLDEKSPLIDWLATYNLEPQPMVCMVDTTVQRSEMAPPDITKFVPQAKTLKSFVPTQRMTVGNGAVLVETENGKGHYEVWEGPHRFCMNPKVRTMAETLAGPGEWLKDPKEHALMCRVDAAGLPVGIAMPVRTPFILAEAA